MRVDHHEHMAILGVASTTLARLLDTICLPLRHSRRLLGLGIHRRSPLYVIVSRELSPWNETALEFSYPTGPSVV